MSQEQFDYEYQATLQAEYEHLLQLQAEYEYQHEYRMPFVVMVKYKLHLDFRSLVEQLPGCKVVKVIEIKTCELLQYWFDCPKGAEQQINDMAFMTFIKNPEFQKYYKDSTAFQKLITNAK